MALQVPGDPVAVGNTVSLIEVMQSFTPIVAEQAGVRNPAAFPGDAASCTRCQPLFFCRVLAISTSRNEAAVISVLIEAMVGSISSRSAVNMRLVSG
jgi:hypothetical protein